MSKISREVEIKSEERQICFDVENNQMPVRDLKRYFPLAVGLTYVRNSKEYCVREKDDYFLLIPNISSYNAFYSKVPADKVYMTQKKEEEFKDILSKIKKTEECMTNEPKRSSSKRIGAAESKQRTIQLGWKHRSDENQKYLKIQKPLGGTKYLTLELKKSYSVQDVIAIGIKAFKTDLNANYFNKCKIALAANDDVEILTFNTEDGDGLWKFTAKLAQTSHRVSLNILTTDTSTQETSISSTVKVVDQKSQNVEVSSRKEKEKKSVKKTANDDYDKSIVNTVRSEDVRLLANMVFGAGQSKKKEIALREALLELKKDEKVENTKINTRQSLGNNNNLNEIVNLDSDCSSIIHVHSKYHQNQNPISREEKRSGNRSVTDDSFRTTNFPDCKTLLKEPSTYDKDNYLTEQGLKDISQVLKENSLKRNLNKPCNVPKMQKVELNNLNLKSNLNEEADFQVPTAPKIKKVHLHNLNSLNVPFITEIPLNDLKITKDFLGRGSYGLVRKGVWSKTKVAVKTIEVLYSSPKNIAKEVAILRQVSHENIVSIMGVCHDSTEFHIVMELIDGHTMHSLINKKSVRELYNLTDNDRHNLCKQICSGITFLHKHPLQIIHRDIKPANILVTRKKQIKICDLGLAKVSELNSVLMTSVGKRIAVGTRVYMAPEVLLHSNPVTQAADVWSLACTLTEVYNEGPVWQLDKNDPYQNLTELLLSRTEPSLLRVPQFLRSILKQCFDYDQENRATAEDLLDCFERTENILGVGSIASSSTIV